MSKPHKKALPTDDDAGLVRLDVPFLTADIDGIGGALKTVPEDFRVEEIPLYPASGEGTHVFALIEKRSMTTAAAIMEIARAMGVRRMDVGYAGRKDARAITKQWISIEHIDADKLAQYQSRAVKVLQVARHGNKLKVGHLAGNRFILRVRKLAVPLKQAMDCAEAGMERLVRVGVPNYFGPQRFGYRMDSHLLGEAVVKNDARRFFDFLLGHPEMDTDEAFIRPRTLYEQGDYQGAYAAWLPNFHDHRYALRDLMRSNCDFQKAFRQFDRQLMTLFVAAWQSDLFNRALAGRMPHIDKLFKGDMAYKHDNGACFKVEDAAVEQPRCDRFEVSPTGPLVGRRMTELTDEAAAFEKPLVDALQLGEEDLQRLGKYGGHGGRRPLRLQPKEAKVSGGADEDGEFLEFQFVLPSGCYATTLLRELMKS